MYFHDDAEMLCPKDREILHSQSTQGEDEKPREQRALALVLGGQKQPLSEHRVG